MPLSRRKRESAITAYLDLCPSPARPWLTQQSGGLALLHLSPEGRGRATPDLIGGSEGEGVRMFQKKSAASEPPHPNPLPSGERECAVPRHNLDLKHRALTIDGLARQELHEAAQVAVELGLFVGPVADHLLLGAHVVDEALDRFGQIG